MRKGCLSILVTIFWDVPTYWLDIAWGWVTDRGGERTNLHNESEDKK